MATSDSKITSVETDRTILLEIYKATNGSKWSDSDDVDYQYKWSKESNLEDWRGIEVNDDGRVIGLDLSDVLLTGPYYN